MSRQYAPRIVLSRNPATFHSRAKVTPKVEPAKVIIPKVTAPREPYVDLPWPETDDFGTTTPKSDPPRKVYTPAEIKVIGDKIIAVIAKEVAMCRGFTFKTPRTHIQLSPAPPRSYELVAYVERKASEENSVKVSWACGSDVITITF